MGVAKIHRQDKRFLLKPKLYTAHASTTTTCGFTYAKLKKHM